MTWYINGVSGNDSSAMRFLGSWDPRVNTPHLLDATGSQGDCYRCSASGSNNLGSGTINLEANDTLFHDGTRWRKANTSDDLVTSVNSKIGSVVLSTTDISEGTNLYFTNARASAALRSHTDDSTIHYTTEINFGTKLTGTAEDITQALHKDKITECENGSTITLTVKLQSLSAGDICCFEQTGAGQVQIAAENAGKQTIPTRCKTNEQYDVIALICVDDTEDAEIYKIIGGVS